jgi:AraC-like DNA-binding protein
MRIRIPTRSRPPVHRSARQPDMPAIAALLDSRAAVNALRRTLPKEGPSVVTCKSAVALRRLFEIRLVDAVVLAPHPSLLPELAHLRAQLPFLPVIAYAPFRPDDGDLLLACREAVSAIAVEGVDDPIIGDLVWRASITAERRRALADAPRMLRLTEPLQRTAWNVLLGEVERPVRTTALAKRLRISREHLSRQFGAGGAPNLKRVIDLTRVACAAQLLGNPGVSVPTVVRVLHFASPTHLSNTARRIANVSTSGLGDLGPRGVLGAFVRGNTRSRV